MTYMTLALTVHLLFGAAGGVDLVQPGTGQSAIRTAIEKQGAAFAAALSRGDAKAIAAMYTEDAIAMPPDAEMVRGRPAIEKLWADALASGIKTIAFTVVDVQSSGEFAVETGRAVLGVQPAGQPATSQTGKYVVVWQRGADGQWRLLRDIWNGTPLPSREVLPVLWVPKVPRVQVLSGAQCSVPVPASCYCVNQST
jgi:uncharacterized protein (TIGR02246 family)